MDKKHGRFDHGGMKKPLQNRHRSEFVPVYLAEWLTALGVAPVELVKAEVISEGYLSSLRSGRKVRPSPAKLKEIGTFLKIQWTDLYRPPPPKQVVEGIADLGAATVERIRGRQSN
jgi:transcriptional regulator with XRE-family HTH domain